MSRIQILAFDLLVNAVVQITVFAVAAAILSPIIARARGAIQHWFYLAVFVACLAVPAVNTFWRVNAPRVSAQPSQTLTSEAGSGRHFIGWDTPFYSRTHVSLSGSAREALLALWAAFILYQSARFGLGIWRVRCLRQQAIPLAPAEQKAAVESLETPVPAVYLKSADILEPVTLGAFQPAILFPAQLTPTLTGQEFATVLAHEFGHIRRKDFLANCLCELAAVPVAWHPGVCYLMSKLSQTRELACDDYAAARVGKRTVYARSLLRLASLCVHAPCANAMGLGIFDGDNLETRIMKLAKKETSLSRVRLFGLALVCSVVLSAGAVLAHGISLQENTASPAASQRFAGTWHWMFQGRSFATMVLVPQGSGFTGTVTGSRIALDDDGYLKKADPTDNAAPSPISKAQFEGDALHVTVMDSGQPFEFLVTLKDSSHAEIRPIGAPPNMKPILADRAS